MSNQLLKKIADELTNARKKKKISIDQVFTKTRIDKKYLTAIEEGNFSIMPDVYIRAFIKEYSLNVGLNPTEILEKYTLAQKGIDFDTNQNMNQAAENSKPLVGKKKKEPAEQLTKEFNHDLKVENQKPEVKFNKSYYYGIVAVLMLVFILVIYKLFLTEANNKIIAEKPFEEIVKTQDKISGIEEKTTVEVDKTQIDLEKIEQKKVELIKPETEQNIAPPTLTQESNLLSKDGLVLTIVSSDKSWIRVESDDKDIMEFTIEESVTKVLNAKEKFYLHIGNSGGIKLFLNNKDIFFSGAPGKVRKIYVTKNGIEYLRRTPEVNVE